MTLLPHLAARLYGVPLAIHRPKLDVILAVLGPRVGLVDLAAPPGFTPPERQSSPAAAQAPQIAVIPIYGTLVRRTVGLETESGLTSYAALTAQLDAAISNPAVSAILLDVDSPGGESGGVFDLADRIRAAGQVKPVWAVANDMAFSAAYALASAASRVFVSRTGGVGSIGVIAMHVDQSEKDAQDGVHYTAVFAGDRKNDLSPHEPISSDAHTFLKAEVNRIYGLFVETVARNRGIEPSAVRDTEAGLFFGQAAVAIGLADAIGTLDDAVAQLLEFVSTPPTLAASHSGLCRNLQLEPSMNDRTDPTTDLATDPADGAAQLAASPAMTAADAIEIAQTCTLAGHAELIAGFLEGQASPAAVRSHLLAAQAATSPEIVSLIAPNAASGATASTAASSPLIEAAKQLAAKSASLKKEF